MKMYKIWWHLLDILAENQPGKQKSRLRQNSDRTPKEPQETLGAHSKRKKNLLLAMWSSLYSLKAEILTIGLWVGKMIVFARSLVLRVGHTWRFDWFYIHFLTLVCRVFRSTESHSSQRESTHSGCWWPRSWKKPGKLICKTFFLCIVIGSCCVMDVLLNACFFCRCYKRYLMLLLEVSTFVEMRLQLLDSR